MPGQYLNHTTAVRLRITGSGLLHTRLISMDNVADQQLVDLTLESTTDRYKTLLANFTKERAQLEVKIDGLGEHFLCRGLIIFTKPIATGYPQ